jgi:hypothetical protein
VTVGRRRIGMPLRASHDDAVVVRHVIRRLINVSAALVVAGAFVIVTVPASAAPSPGWSLMPTPNQQGSGGGLNAVSCAAADSCVAVGSVDVGFSVIPAAESWNGKSWSLQHGGVPAHGLNASLAAVSCSSARACIAVGSYQTPRQARLRSGNTTRLAEFWDGRTWSVVLKSGGGALDSVSCPSATSCVAVGYTNANSADTVASSVAEQWKGHRWAVQRLPHFGGPRLQALNAVACASAAACIAVGQAESFTTGRPIAARWNGRRWIGTDIPNLPHASQSFVQPVSLSCSSSKACMAIGSTYPYSTSAVPEPSSPLAWRWNGRKWTFVSVPSTLAFDSFTAAISCPVVNRCLAVDWKIQYGQTVGQEQLAAWNGQSWTVSTSTTNSRQTAISCTSRSQCTTVGVTAQGRTLAERCNGSQESVQRTADPQVERFSQQLTSLSCLRSARCVAINSYGELSGGTSSSAEDWNGARWRLRSFATLASANNTVQTVLSDVSCPVAGSPCMVVGQSVAGFAGGNREALAESWNGTSFSLLPAPPDAGDLLGVSCVSASACVAVGDANVQSVAAIDSWNGSGWTSQAAAVGATELTAISCATATDCMALGVNEANGAIAEFFNGTSWTLEPLPAKANPIAIDCPTVTRCIAVGTGTIDYWNGTTWSAQSGVSSREQLDAVSCLTASSCMAVGDQAARMLAEYWNGNRWTAQRPPIPKGSTRSLLTGIACSPDSCMAVGAYTTKSLHGAWQNLADHYSRA